jgi:hypothetical protein
MRLAAVTLTPVTGTPIDLNLEAVLDALWVHTDPADGVEHIRVSLGASGIDVAAFGGDIDPADLRNRLQLIVQNAINATPAMAGLHII